MRRPPLHRRARRLAPLMAAAALTACAGADAIRSRATLVDATQLGAQGSVAYPTDRWWSVYGDARLDRLVERALADSPTVRVANARLARAQAQGEIAGAPARPQLNLSADSSRQRLSRTYIYPAPLGGSTQTLNTLTLGAGWETDLFGRHRAALEAAIGSERAARADLEAARVLLAARVAAGYFALAHRIEARALAAARLTERERIRALVAQRVAAGLDSLVELRQAEGAIPLARETLAQIEEQIALNRHALAALTGAGPYALSDLAPRLGALRIPPLPATLPADLMGRRADLAAARWRAEAAARDIGVARAEFYPNLSLSAFLGFQSLGLSRWIEAGSRMAGIGPALRLPLFDGGRLEGNLRARSADYDAAVEDYNARLVDALREVADQLASRAAIETQAREQAAALGAAESAFDLAQQRYRAGLSGYLTVLTAELAVEEQRIGVLDLTLRRHLADVELVRALGGGFQDTLPPAPSAQP